ncbi:TfoX/Sxy family DNA transformation protein [Nonomuraea sp. NPDC050783]|uniref:TfoX/Sxy family DNA transformation protein n=1 Tax=Nonomuraea sp. NPDC050783 TaxID=3154634 RepID=UPI003465EBBC
MARVSSRASATSGRPLPDGRRGGGRFLSEPVARLAELAAVEVYRRLQDVAVPGLSLNALWAMEGALTDTDWRHLPPQRKAEPPAELADH